MIGLALLLSENRRLANWRLICIGLLAQIALAVLILQGDAMGEFFSPLGWPKIFFSWLSFAFVKTLQFSTEGARFRVW